MKCINCGKEIGTEAQFCGNCGNKVTQIIGQNSSEGTQNLQPTKKEKNKKPLIVLGIILGAAVLIVLIAFIINKYNKFEDPFDDIDDLNIVSEVPVEKGFIETKNSFTLIKEDFENENISADEYIMQLAYSLYDLSKLNSKYKNTFQTYISSSILFKEVDKYIDSLSDDTIIYLVKKIGLNDVKWKTNDNGSVNTVNKKSTNKYSIKQVVDDEYDVSQLDKAILSSEKHFIIYYSESGKNAITNDDANRIADYLEYVVGQYKKKFNLNFKYEPQLKESNMGELKEVLSFGLFEQPATKARNILKNNNIDEDIINTALPVYIIDTDSKNSGLLGMYSAPLEIIYELLLKAYDIFEDGGLMIDAMITSYTYPYFIVSSTMNQTDDMKVVLAHELFHHYQKYICGNGEYELCKSDNFTEETTANYAASSIVNTNRNDLYINTHAAAYVNDIESSLDINGYKNNGDDGVGYGAYVFANNYAEVVPNGAVHLFDSMKETEPLQYIFNQSNGKYKDALILTAKKNLTLDYTNKTLISYKDGNIIYPPNHVVVENNDIKHNEVINYSSMHYYYINPKDYGTKTQISFNSLSSDLTLLLFIRESNTYKYLYTHNLNKEFVISIDDFSNYSELVIAIVDSSISGTDNYSYELDNKGTKTPTVTAKSLNLKTSEIKIENSSSFVCHSVENDGTYKTVLQIKLSFDKKDAINEMYFKGTIQMLNYDPSNPTFKVAQKVVSGLLNVMKNAYEEKFRYYDILTKEGTDKYSVTFKVKKNYYEALRNSLDIKSNNKTDIIKELQGSGFICESSN